MTETAIATPAGIEYAETRSEATGAPRPMPLRSSADSSPVVNRFPNGDVRECPHSIELSVSTKGVLTATVKMYYEDSMGAGAIRARLLDQLDELATIPAFALQKNDVGELVPREGLK